MAKSLYTIGQWAGAVHRLPTSDLCNIYRDQTEELDKNNVSSSEVWLVQGKVNYDKFVLGYGFSNFDNLEEFIAAYLDNVVKGSCSKYGRMLLVLSQCPGTGKVNN